MIRTLAASFVALALLASCNQNSAPQASISSSEHAQLEGLIRSYLDSNAQTNAQGFAPAAGVQDQIARLQPEGDHRWDVNLAANTPYRIIGVCDNECSNVDMELLDHTGAVVQSDVLPDDIPIINITPTANDRYTVRLILKTCTLAPCYVGGRVLQQAAQPAAQPAMAPLSKEPK
jgi:hypothetical protein